MERKLPKDFFEMVYQVVRLVPKGRVTSYGAIARYLGAPGAARMVGYAMNASHTAKHKVPAHRVLNRNGQLSGKMHFSRPFEMEALLAKEGVKVSNDSVCGFAKIFWDPHTELKI